MKDKIPMIAGGLLGLIFIVFGLNFFLNFLPKEFDPTGDPTQFYGALFGDGYLHFVKGLEVLGGLLLLIPKTRNFGIIIIVPIIVNILAYKIFLQRGGAIMSWDAILIVVLMAVVGATSAKSFLRLLN